MTTEFLVIGVLWYVVFLLSTTAHEASHALAAKLGGDPTAFHGGQVTLDPLPHIRREPFGMVLVPILSYATGGWMMGWASAPYDPRWQQTHPRRAAWMSLAGPAANFTLAVIAGVSIHIGILTGAFHPPESANFQRVVEATASGFAEGAAKFFSLLFSLNVLLGTFNLLPIPPLDGYGALGLFVTDNGARRLEEMRQRARSYSFIGLLLGWQLFAKIYEPLFTLALQALYPTLHYG
ncbi:MAG: site-2 protease family protein [Acidobacteriia bacterium]|nr:site-2 protease family protein [Terriglobia bacterium]